MDHYFALFYIAVNGFIVNRYTTISHDIRFLRCMSMHGVPPHLKGALLDCDPATIEAIGGQ